MTLHSAEDNEDTGLLPREALERRTGAELDARVELERDAGAELREVGDEADDADDDTVLLAREKLERAELELDTELLEREVGAELLREAEELKRMDEGVGERGYSSRRRSGVSSRTPKTSEALMPSRHSCCWNARPTRIRSSWMGTRGTGADKELISTARSCCSSARPTRPRSCCAR